MYTILGKRKDIHFYYIAPKEVIQDFVDYPNVTVLPINYPGWARFCRFHFNIPEIRKVLQIKPAGAGGFDFDTCLMLQPEITPNLNTVLNCGKGGYYDAAEKVTMWGGGFAEYRMIPFINYFQVLATPDDERYDPIEFFKEIEGILAADVSLLPSNWIYKSVLKTARSLFKERMIDILKKKMRVLYFGIPFGEFDKYRVKDGSKFDKFTIAYNSRILSYNGPDIFMRYMRELWKRRQDFQIYMFDPIGRAEYLKEENPQLPIKIFRVTREKYIELFSKCHVAVSTFRFQQFPQAMTDAMICEIPLIAPRKLAMPEIAGEKYKWLFRNDKEFMWKINYLMDNPDELRRSGDYLRKRAHELFDWETRIDDYIEVIEEVADIKPPKVVTPSMKEIKEFILKRGGASKKEIFKYRGWGMTFSQIAWNHYRRYLLSEGFVEDYTSPIPFFMPATYGQTTFTKPDKEIKLEFEKEEEELDISFEEPEEKEVEIKW